MMASSSSGAASPHATATQATIKPAHAICRLAICRIILLDMYAATATQATSKPGLLVAWAITYTHAPSQQNSTKKKLQHRQPRREEGRW